MGKVVEDNDEGNEGLAQSLDALAREGARRMIATALEAEVEEYVRRFTDERDERGRALVVRNGRGQERKLTLGSGTMSLRAPRVNDKRVVDGERQKFASKILPPYLRRSRNVSEVLPVLYLRGLSTGDFSEALSQLLGDDASGLSSSAITRLLRVWQDEYRAWRTRPLDQVDYVYVWADGVHFNVRLDDDRLAALVLIGARPDGTKEVIAIEDGFRESKESWLELLRDLKQRGMRAPVVATGDGALGFWAALREVFPTTLEQRCWVHVIANVLDKLPKSIQPRAKAALHAMMYATSEAMCRQRIAAFAQDYAKYPKAVASLTTNVEPLLTFFSLPVEHWKHVRTTNPIESTFATVKLRQRVTKGAGSRAAGLAMAYKLMLTAERTWRCLDGAALLPSVRAGVCFKDGLRVERADQITPRRAMKRTQKPQPQNEKVAA
jgi:transposase-like protein